MWFETTVGDPTSLGEWRLDGLWLLLPEPPRQNFQDHWWPQALEHWTEKGIKGNWGLRMFWSCLQAHPWFWHLWAHTLCSEIVTDLTLEKRNPRTNEFPWSWINKKGSFLTGVFLLLPLRCSTAALCHPELSLGRCCDVLPLGGRGSESPTCPAQVRVKLTLVDT